MTDNSTAWVVITHGTWSEMDVQGVYHSRTQAEEAKALWESEALYGTADPGRPRFSVYLRKASLITPKEASDE